MRNDRRIAGPLRQFDRIQRLSQRADLIQLDQDRVSDTFLDPFGKDLHVRHKNIIPDQLHPLAQLLREHLPALPIQLAQPVFNREDWIPVQQLAVIRHHLLGRPLRVLFCLKNVAALVIEFARRAIQRQRDIPAGFVAGIFNRLRDEAERLFIRLQVRRKSTFIADRRVEALLLQQGFERVKHFRGHAERVTERLGSHRHDHKLLEVQPVVGMRAAIDDVHQRHRQDPCICSPEIAIERLTSFIRRRLRHGQRDAENGIGAQLAFSLRSVQRDHGVVDVGLIERLATEQFRRDHFRDISHRLGDTLAHPTLLIAVPQLDRFLLAGGGARRHRRPADRAALQHHFRFHRRVATGIDNLPALNFSDRAHTSLRSSVSITS